MQKSLYAKIRLKNPSDATTLGHIFFEKFDPESSISINGMEAEIEKNFQTIPKELIEILKAADIQEISYKGKKGKYHKRVLQETTDSVISPNIDKNVESLLNPSLDQISDIVSEADNSADKLKKIATIATSFENFLELIAKWLDLGAKRDFFIRFVTEFGKNERIPFGTFYRTLQEKGIKATSYDHIRLRKKIYAKISNKNIKEFFAEIVKYKSFPVNEAAEDSNTEDCTKKEEIVVEDQNEGQSVKLHCMPKVPDFEEKLAKMDKDLPIDDKVTFILKEMGLDDENSQHKKFLELTKYAMRAKELDLDQIFCYVGIPKEDWLEVKVLFSQFVNNFIQLYEPEKRVKIADFLYELKKFIMLK